MQKGKIRICFVPNRHDDIFCNINKENNKNIPYVLLKFDDRLVKLALAGEIKVTEEMSNVKKYTSLSIVRHDDLVQIVLRRNRIINFNIHPKQFQQTLERFRESAVIDKGYNFLEIEKEIIKRKYIPHILHRER